MDENINARWLLMGKAERQVPVAMIRRRCEDNIKIGVKGIG
jgi:F420-0:gamma-glutamyl ligase